MVVPRHWGRGPLACDGVPGFSGRFCAGLNVGSQRHLTATRCFTKHRPGRYGASSALSEARFEWKPTTPEAFKESQSTHRLWERSAVTHLTGGGSCAVLPCAEAIVWKGD